MSSEDEIEYIETKRTDHWQQQQHRNEPSSSENDDDSDDQDKPSGSECLSRCKQFAEVTGTDSALAMFFLQDTKWELEAALNNYFRVNSKESKKKIVACMDVETLNEDERYRIKYNFCGLLRQVLQ
jgi:hypothetical protein